jgi:hypothetical protein
MKVKSRTTTEDYLRKTKLPLATKSYTVIPHGVVIDAIREKLQENGFIVTNELYKAEYNGDIAMGFMHIQNDMDPDMGMTFNFTNSYNKMIRFGCSVGGFIYDNEVPFLTSNNSASWIRKHTGTALDEAMEVIDVMISCANEHFQEVIDMKEKLKAIQVDRKEYAKLIGLLYLDKEILFSDQVSVIKHEYKKPSFDYKDKGTLWEIYKMIMFAIAEKSPKIWHEQQMKISAYIQVLYNFASEAVANEEVTGELDFTVAESNDEVANDNTEQAFEWEKPEAVDLDAEEDNDWAQLEVAGIITPCVGHDKETERLEEIREEINNESVSYGEIVELQELSEFIEEGDVQLLEAASVPEFPVDEMESVDNFILAQNEIIEAKYDNEINTITDTDEFFATESAEEMFAFPNLVDDVVLPTPMTDEQIEIVQEEFGIIEKGHPDDGYIGSTVIEEEDTNNLFDLIDEEDDDNDEVPWFTDDNPQVKEVSIIPDAIREEVSAILSERYGNKRKVTNVNDVDGNYVVELDSHEFFVVN